MDGIRAFIGVKEDDEGKTVVTIEWTDVTDNSPGQTLTTETVRFNKASTGRYVSRTVFGQGEFLPGTLYVDAEGKRHFGMTADPATVAAEAVPVLLTHDS